jgi:transposase
MDIKDNYIKELEAVVERQRLHIMQLESTILSLESTNLKLESTVLKLEQRITDLERRLKLNSHTSNKPPSSDGLRKKPTPVSLRSKGELPSGGQLGHKGSTLEQEPIPTEIISHPVTTCRDCGLSLADAAIEKITKRQVFDIPAPQIVVTEHQVASKRCCCGSITTSCFPAAITAPVQYGPRIKSLAVYLMNQQFIPEDRLQHLFKDVFSLPISTATLANVNTVFADKVINTQTAVLEALKLSPVKHLDETGFRIGGKTQWLHVISNQNATYYHVSAKRGHLLTGLSGTIVHDHWKPYFTIPDVQHGLCNAHHLRELKALEELEGENWAARMGRLLRFSNKIKGAYDRISKVYDRIIKDGLAFHDRHPPLEGRKKRTGHNLLLRLQSFKEAVLRFYTDPSVPFTNNQAEQDLRMMKVKQKISGGFRTTKGAECFATIRGFIATKVKQNLNAFQAIQAEWG